MASVRAALYLDAARHMRPRQLLYRLRRLVPPSALAAGLPTGAPPEPWWAAAGLDCDPAPQSGPTPLPHEDGAVSAFGIRRAIDAAGFWREPSDGLLFLFHLHGFSELSRYASGPRTSAGDAFWARLLEDWLVRERRPSLPAWHPYPTSGRIVAWVVGLSSIGSWPGALRGQLTAELWRQASYLCRCVEHDIGGNHVLRNAKALVFAGSVFPGTRLLDRALALLERETGRQLLTDGGHEERSSSYHRLVQHDLAEVAELLVRVGRRAPGWLTHGAALAARWQAGIAGPDRRLPLLNDAWEGPALTAGATQPPTALGAEFGPGEAGYLVLRSGGDQVIFDLGPLCPAHLPAHAHADALSFVLWLDGQPLVVDPGSYCYQGPLRDRFRATSCHNTVEVDGRDQCVLWGSFRAAHLPRVRHGPPRRQGEAIVVSGAHDGYARLPDPVEHQRVLAWLPPAGLLVVDRLWARRSHRVRSSLHLAADVPVTDGGSAGAITISALGEGASQRTRLGSYSPYLGSIVAAPTLEDTRTVDPGQLFGWSVLRRGWRLAQLSPERVALERDDERSIAVALSWV